MLSYRKTKDGDWAVFGPAAEVAAGRVTVTKKDGTRKEETITAVSRPFDVDGVPHCFGYLGRPQGNGAGRPGARKCVVCGREERRNARGYVETGTKILRSGECADCYEERKMGY